MTTWPEIYREHAAGLRAFLRHRLRSAEAAEDLCNETFVKAIEAEDSLRDRSKIRSFLYRIAHNLSLNQLRRPDTVRTENELAGGIDWEAETNADEACPSSVVEQRAPTLPAPTDLPMNGVKREVRPTSSAAISLPSCPAATTK